MSTDRVDQTSAFPEPAAWQKAIRRAEEDGFTILGWEQCTGLDAAYLSIPTRALYTAEQMRAYAQKVPPKLWLWRNHVDGRPEYWAFDNPYPCISRGGDPLTLGQPCGYALVKWSVNGRPEIPESAVLAEMRSVATRPDCERVAILERVLQAARAVAFSQGFDAAYPEKLEALRAIVREVPQQEGSSTPKPGTDEQKESQ